MTLLGTRRPRSTLALLLSFLAGSAAIAAPPQATYLYPAGARQGESIEVTVGGSFSNWPANVWIDSDQLTIEPLEKSGEIRVNVAAAAACGVHWLRFYDAEGASAVRPFMVGSLAELMEQEPNDDPLHPQRVEHSMVVNGRLGKRGDVDTFTFHLNAGESLVAALQANSTLGSPVDSVMQICDSQGFVLAQNNDARELDPLLVFKAPVSGDYLVRTFGFPAQPNSTIAFAGGDDYIYRLTLTTGGFLHHTMPLALPAGEAADVRLIGWNFDPLMHRLAIESTDRAVAVYQTDIAEAVQLPRATHPILVAEEQFGDKFQPVTLPIDISGCLAQVDRTDAFRFTAQKNEKLQFRVESRARGFPLDALLQLVSIESGEVLIENDDANKLPDPALAYTIKADGEYEVRIRDLYGHGGERYAYRLIAEPAVPDFSLSSAVDSFVVRAGEMVEVAVAIDRINGHVEELAITAIDLPAGVESSTETSAGKGDSAKSVKLRLTAATDAQSGTFRLQARWVGEHPKERVARFRSAVHGADWETIWLTTQPAQAN